MEIRRAMTDRVAAPAPTLLKATCTFDDFFDQSFRNHILDPAEHIFECHG